MQFSDTTNKSGLIQDCEFLCNTGDAGISGNTTLLKQFTSNINRWYHKVVTMILKAQDDWDFDDTTKTDFPIITTSLVANQQDYGLPVTCLQLKRVEVTYDGTNWYKAEKMDINERGLATDTTSVGNSFNESEPFYDIVGNSIMLYPIPAANSSNGLKVWITREPTEFVSTDTTDEPGIDEPFHRMLSIGASFDWAVAKQLNIKNDLASLLADYENRLLTYYGKKATDYDTILKPSYINYE